MSRAVVVGAGAREHALAWGLSKSVDVIVTPGNDGMRASGLTCVATSPLELEADLFVIGPDALLVEGLASELRAQGKTVFGPGIDGAQLEGSKAYMKEFLRAANVPTAAFGVFDNEEDASRFLSTMKPPYVVKTDGLAAGKGVLVTEDLDEAMGDVREKLSGAAFGDAGTTVVIEEGLVGVECSMFVLCDGTRCEPLIPSQDFKRVGDFNTGPNTGGMGALAPLSLMDDAMVDRVMTEIIAPTVKELQHRGIEYRGVFYAGVMLTKDGPKLLEYNVRFGDPETQVLIPLFDGDLYEALLATAKGDLRSTPSFKNEAAVTVVLAAQGYPGTPRGGDVISGLNDDGQLGLSDVVIFHAGTKRRADGTFVTGGGRVLNVSARGATLEDARRRAYEAASLITFEGRVMRNDIAVMPERSPRELQ